MANTKKSATTVAVLGLLMACNRSGSDDLADQRHFDSLVARRDTIVAHYQAQQDSVAKVLFGEAGGPKVQSAPTPIRSDSDLEERPPIAAPSRPAAVATAPAPARTAPPAHAAVNAITQRGLALGDSIARADANRMLGNSGKADATDSVRGVVQSKGRRAIIKTSNKTMISLSGMGTDGIAALVGAEIVVHGLKISPQDMVVKSFVVLTVKGVPALDGRLDPNGTGWVLTLSNGAGVQRLTAVSAALQAVSGSRVWIALAPGTTTPQVFGVIGRR